MAVATDLHPRLDPTHLAVVRCPNGWQPGALPPDVFTAVVAAEDETTVILPEALLDEPAWSGEALQVDAGWRRITFAGPLPWELVGFLADVEREHGPRCIRRRRAKLGVDVQYQHIAPACGAVERGLHFRERVIDEREYIAAHGARRFHGIEMQRPIEGAVREFIVERREARAQSRCRAGIGCVRGHVRGFHAGEAREQKLRQQVSRTKNCVSVYWHTV